MRRPIGILAGTTATLATILALSACGQTDDTLNFGSFTDCAKVGTPVVTNDPVGDQRTSAGVKANAEPKGDLLRLRLAKRPGELCVEFEGDAPIRPYAAYVLTMRPQATDTPVVQLEASVLAGQAPEVLLDASGSGQHFRKIKAKVGISGHRISILVTRAPFDKVGVGAIFRSFRFQARSAVAAKGTGRLTDCMPVCE
ncbi:MAG: hypothetical protein JWQ18_614 [Conexibacter sp.]|nr:hypothetical protein [Conexibacter sp.]